jgi:hypothetical protein
MSASRIVFFSYRRTTHAVAPSQTLPARDWKATVFPPSVPRSVASDASDVVVPPYCVT